MHRVQLSRPVYAIAMSGFGMGADQLKSQEAGFRARKRAFATICSNRSIPRNSTPRSKKPCENCPPPADGETRENHCAGQRRQRLRFSVNKLCSAAARCAASRLSVHLLIGRHVCRSALVRPGWITDVAALRGYGDLIELARQTVQRVAHFLALQRVAVAGQY